MEGKEYKNYWLVFVDIKAKEGFEFVNLIDSENSGKNDNFKGAWSNIIVKSKNIKDALDIVHLGLDELNFEVVFADKIENIGSLIEYNEINDNVRVEVDWLAESEFVFKISEKLFPYE